MHAPKRSPNPLIFFILLAIAGSSWSCGSKPKSSQQPDPAGGSVAAEPGDENPLLVALEDAPDGLNLRLSEGERSGPKALRVRRADAEKISDADARRLLARMPALAKQQDDEKDFAFRERSLPPPRTGETVEKDFPAPPEGAKPAGAKSGDLEVLRFAPKGDVPIAPHLSVTFSHPMVAVTSHEDATGDGVPVELEPQPEGQWRWVGTRTLLFDPDVRFPMATRYRIKVAEGTRSASGLRLDEEVSFQFQTPPPQVKRSWPTHGPHGLEPVFFVLFDQEIDPAAVLKTIRVKGGGETYAVRAATSDEIQTSETVPRLIEQAEKNEQSGRYVTFRADRKLAKGTRFTVEVGPGTPSAEGPRKTKSLQSYHFRTYDPLRVVRHRCAWGNRCPPRTPWSIRFNNPLDAEDFDPSTLRVEPELPGMKTKLSGSWMSIQGRSKGRTTYRVTLPATLKDEFGQVLGDPKTLEFRVGDANPQLLGKSGLVLLDPKAKKPTFSVHSVNVPSLDVEVYRVKPSQWDGFVSYMRRNPRKRRRPPGKRVVKRTVKVEKDRDEMVETRIDLSPAVGEDGLGHAVVVVEPTRWKNRYKPHIHAWVQATHIGLDAFVDSTELLAWASRLDDGSPLEDVELEIVPFGTSRKTGEDGLAELPLSQKKGKKKRSHLLLGKRGDDVAFLPENTYWWSRHHGGWYRKDLGETLRWFTYDDRHMYRPGEEVHVKGWIRRLDNGEGGDLGGLRGAVERVRYKVRGPRGNEILKGKIDVSDLGGFDLEFDLPKTPNLGNASLVLTAVGKGGVGGRTHHHTFQIQEFRRPEFEVKTSASEGPHLVGEDADVTAEAKYYAGGGLQNADVRWTVRTSPTSFVPPNRDDYTFGTWTPWWSRRSQRSQGSKVESLSGKTDATGSHVLHLDFLSAKPPRPMSVIAQARVTDVNRQAWASNATLLVHPSELYVGLKRDRYFVERGEPIEIDALVVDHDGEAVADQKVEVEAVRLDWTYEDGEWKEVEENPQECELTSSEDPIECSFETPDGGTYRITATVRDDRGRPSQTQFRYWVTGGKVPPKRNVEQEEVTLVPDKEEYQPGDTARLLVQAPFAPAEGLLSVRRSGVTTTRRFELEDTSTTLEVPIEERHVPNLHVQVDLVGAAERVDDAGEPNAKLPKRPAYAVGKLKLPVPPKSRTLSLDVEPEDREIEPGGETDLDVRVTDASGSPVRGAELSVVVVDEAVLALSSYETPDPIPAFYRDRPAGVRDHYARKYVQLARPDEEALASARDGSGEVKHQEEARFSSGALGGVAADAPAEAEPPPRGRVMAKRARRRKGGGGGSAQPQAPITVRKDFGALAVFAPEVETGADGRARVEVEVPDNLTRYRVMVVAAAGEKSFGHGESSITARMPLMVRPSPPRFLNFGDVFELPIVLQNQTDEEMSVEVAVRATNAAITDGQGRRVKVPANDRVEVRFPAASEMPGTARFQIGASAGGYADASELALPVWTPATSEAFATYGEIDEGSIEQPVKMPEDVVEEFGGLEVTTSSTQLQALTDALLYLVHYPYECTEQTSSRILAIAGLRDVLQAFEARDLPPPKELAETVARDVEHLESLQNPNGGFAFWVRGHRSWPYVSIHAANALVRAKEKGYEVPAHMIARSKRYLRNIERHIPWYYPPKVKRTLIAYSLYVRKRIGDRDIPKAKKLMRQAGLDGLSLEAIGWLLGTMTGDGSSRAQQKKIVRYLQNRVTETAATAHFASSYSDGAHLILHSKRRADGIILESLIEHAPKSDLIPKVTRGLLAHRKRGRWKNTQENAFVLLAMDRYFHTYENVTPNFVARAWLGDTFAGEQRFKGRETKRLHLEVPMSYLAKTGREQDLILQKKGKGRLYYRIGMTYAPEDLELDPADHGFAVQRTYEAVNDPNDVERRPDGTWEIEAGAMVRVRLTMVAEARRYHVALVDPLPAGLEPMNPDLAVTGSVPEDPKKQKRAGPYWWWLRPWYEHQNMRDERVEAFTSLLPAGVHEYTYVARATTPGKFVVPPTKAEEMYFPETFGRTGTHRVVITD